MGSLRRNRSLSLSAWISAWSKPQRREGTSQTGPLTFVPIWICVSLLILTHWPSDRLPNRAPSFSSAALLLPTLSDPTLRWPLQTATINPLEAIQCTINCDLLLFACSTACLPVFVVVFCRISHEYLISLSNSWVVLASPEMSPDFGLNSRVCKAFSPPRAPALRDPLKTRKQQHNKRINFISSQLSSSIFMHTFILTLIQPCS